MAPTERSRRLAAAPAKPARSTRPTKATSPPPAGLWRPRDRAAFVVEMLGGARSAARIFQVAPSQPSRWASGQAVPDPANAQVLVDLDHVLATALQVWTPDVARDWLVTANAHLDGARPIDYLRQHGSAAVVAALHAEAAGAYA